MNKKIQDATKRISTLECLLERAEKDAKVKSQQVSDKSILKKINFRLESFSKYN